MNYTERLHHYALAKGLVVKFRFPYRVAKDMGPQTQACLIGSVIYIKADVSKALLPYYLAHEIGHYLDAERIARSKGLKELRGQHRRYRLYRRAKAQGRKFHTSLLLTARHMEIRATALGGHLMNHLNLPINRKLFDQMSIQNLRSYV